MSSYFCYISKKVKLDVRDDIISCDFCNNDHEKLKSEDPYTMEKPSPYVKKEKKKMSIFVI